MKKEFWLCCLLLCASAISLAAESVDQYVQSQMRKQKIPGLSLAIVRNGTLIESKGYGFSNLELQVPVKPETIFQSGSLGKQFTATAVMLLVEEGKIHLDDSVASYFPGSPDSWKKITIRHLLTHTSGIPDYTEHQVDFRKDYTEDDLLKVLQQLPLDFQPGEKWSYSNSGYMLLGFLIHKVSGKFYGDLLQERVFGPLQMTTTRVISEADIVPNRAAGYELDKNGDLKNQEWVSPTLNTTADGALYLSALDLAKWDKGLQAGQILSKESWKQVWTPVTLNNGTTYPYGFGWRLNYQRGYRLIEHSGHWQGFSTGISRYVDFGLTVIVMANLADVSTPDLAHAIAGLIQPELLAPQFLSAAASETRVAEFKKALADIAAHDHAAGCTQGLAGAIDDDYRKQLSDIQLKMTLVEFRGCDEVQQKQINLYGSPVARFCYFTARTPGQANHFTMAFTADGKVADISYMSE